MQKPHPPIWIPGGGSVETWQWCAEMDYVYAYLSYFGFKAGQATMQGFWDEMDRLGKDRNPYRAGFLQFVGVAETRERGDAALHASRPNISTAAACTSTRAARCRPAISPRRRSAPASRARSAARPSRDAPLQKARATTDMSDIVEQGYVIIGSPDEVAEQLNEVATNLNVGHLMLLLQFGNMGKELAAYNTKLFADE